MRERYTPTPEEIRAECEKIREGWDELRWSREEKYVEWQVPIIEAKKMSGPPMS